MCYQGILYVPRLGSEKHSVQLFCIVTNREGWEKENFLGKMNLKLVAQQQRRKKCKCSANQ